MNLQLGVGREIITPEIGCNLYGYRPDIYSESVHDDLTATAFALSFGEEKAILISLTVGAIMTWQADQIRQAIASATGIPAENVMLCATHTHTGPILKVMDGWGDLNEGYYYDAFVPRVVAAAVTAWKNREAVTLGSAMGTSLVGINRRELTLANNVTLGQNPWGPFDSRMCVLSFKNKAGKIIGNVISYGCHGTAAGTATAISRDWSGVMTDALEAHTGGITAFFNGTIGDVGPRLSNGKTTGDLSYVEEIGQVAAADAICIFEQISQYEDTTISACSNILQIPLEPRMPYEEAVRLYDPEKEKNSVNLEKKQMAFYRRVKESYENGYVERPCKEIFQNIIRIGSFAFVAFPYDVFSVIGMRINEAVADLNVFGLSHSNGSESYFPTQDQICLGGYEVGSFKTGAVQPYPDNADYHLIMQTLRNLENLKR